MVLARLGAWAAAHSHYASQPTSDRPDGAVIATTTPERWASEPVRVLGTRPDLARGKPQQATPAAHACDRGTITWPVVVSEEERGG